MPAFFVPAKIRHHADEKGPYPFSIQALQREKGYGPFSEAVPGVESLIL
jgi:hypothetical protein